jgi:hypothetical protein
MEVQYVSICWTHSINTSFVQINQFLLCGKISNSVGSHTFPLLEAFYNHLQI